MTSVWSPTRNGKSGTWDPGNVSHKETFVHHLEAHTEQPARCLNIWATEITMVHSDPRDRTHKRTPGRNPSYWDRPIL
jgi:hypothetical protein